LSGEIAVDTNVFTARLRRDSDLSGVYAKHVLGHTVAVAPQTVAEARYGALKSAQGAR
jgi:predicted nucleic acid-binding protein